MGTISYTIPTAGSTLNSIAAPEVDSALQTLLTWANGNVDGANMPSSLTGRRLVLAGYVPWISGTGPETQFAVPDGNLGLQAPTTGVASPAWSYLDPTNFAVTGKANTQLILRLSAGTNGTAPAANFTAALNPATFGGATSGQITIAVGAAVAGSSATLNTPGASTAAVAESAPFTFPAAGAYVLTVANSAVIAANNFTSMTVQLFALNS